MRQLRNKTSYYAHQVLTLIEQFIEIVSKLCLQNKSVNYKHLVEEKPTYQSSGGTKPVDNVKLEVSKQYTIAPAYNKGPSMVVGKKDIKDIGR